jgi:AraC-like DNA-binding protein
MARIAIVIRLAEVRKLAQDCGYRAREIAKRMGLSLSQLERRFHDEHKIGPQRYLNALEMQDAALKLEKERLVKAVAFEMGYTRSSFTRAFKRHCGVSPAAYIARTIQRQSQQTRAR